MNPIFHFINGAEGPLKLNILFSETMNDKGKGFMLTPSRLGKPAVEVAKPVFTGRNQFSQTVTSFLRQ